MSSLCLCVFCGICASAFSVGYGIGVNRVEKA